MIECKKCNKLFRDNYNLNKHVSRKTPCFIIKTDFLETIKENDPKNDTLDPKNDTLDPKNDKICQFCLNTFSTNWYKNNHEKICKSSKDPLRLFEMENGIKPLTCSKNQCRFCNVSFCRPIVLQNHYKICKKRENYFEKIKKENVVQTNIQNANQIQNANVINNINNINNNVTIINMGGKETIDHIEIEQILELWRTINKTYDNSQIYLKAGKLVTSFDNLIRELPENKNIFIPNSKCLYSEVKTPTGWEKKEVEESLNTAFKNSAKLLYGTKESIETHNDKVFKVDQNKRVFSEVKQFADRGLDHTNSQYYCPDDQRKIRSGYKIGKLKDRVTDDDF